MDLGEATATSLASENHDEDCYFCKAGNKPPTTEVNDLTPDSDEDEAELDSMGEYKFKNDAGKLGTALGGKPEAKQVEMGGLYYDAAVAAHHLLPGNASLKKCRSLMKRLWTDGEAKGNVGYNINANPNGVWTPGNYGVRPWGTKGKTFVKGALEKGVEVTAKDFAFATMEAWGCQFHDSHPEYSRFVHSVLNKINDKLRASEFLWCPEQKKNKEGERRGKDTPVQMFELVGRLNTVSARMKRMLVFPTTNWKSNVYTSEFVQDYMKEKNHQLGETDTVNKE